MPGPPPSRNVPFLDKASNEDLGALLRAAVDIVRREAGYEGDDPTADVEVVVKIRRLPNRG